MKDYRYKLEAYRGPSSRFRCPACNHPHKFTRYIDTRTNEYLSDDVGRCDREDKCGYHVKPSQFIKDSGTTWTPSRPREIEIIREPDIIPDLPIEKTILAFRENELFRWTADLFGEETASNSFETYLIGSSKHWKGATAFHQIDYMVNPRQSKVMHYTRVDQFTIRRTKSPQMALKYDYKRKIYIPDTDNGDKIFFAGKRILNDWDAYLVQCFFGEFLLNYDKYQWLDVAIVESEKTALICSIFWPQYLWLATGGRNGCKWRDPSVFKVLEGRNIVLFPDLGCFESWDHGREIIESHIKCRIQTSDILEREATPSQREDGLDLADFLLEENGFPQSKRIDNNNK